MYAHPDNLKLVIPWNNLFAGVWEAHVSGLVLLVAPNTSITYDKDKEEKLLHQTKMAMLDKIAEAQEKARAASQNSSGPATASATDDGYLEKLIAQIVRNIQVTIKDVHIRYEDSVSTPEHPFSFGVTLASLSVVSTDKDYTPCLDDDRLVYKLLSLEGLGVYWEPDATLLSDACLPGTELCERLKAMIPHTAADAASDPVETDLLYVLSPLSLCARLQLNPRPELDAPEPFTTPKLSLALTLHHLGLGVSRRQYCGVMALVESLDRMRVAARYRHHRPTAPGRAGHAADWWRYAYMCQLDSIRRVRENWSWTHMKEHRQLCRTYMAAYKAHLMAQKTPKNKEVLEECEKKLDLFNISVVRRQALVEVEREGRHKEKQEAPQSKGWFGGWLSWGGKPSPTQDDASPEATTVSGLADKLTAEEKAELFSAIGHSEGALPPTLPTTYKDLRLHFLLSSLTFRLTNDLGSEDVDVSDLSTTSVGAVQTILRAEVAGLRMDTSVRSAANAVRRVLSRAHLVSLEPPFECSLGSFIIDGVGCDEAPSFTRPGDVLPYRLVDSLEVNSTTDLVEFLYESNPLPDEGASPEGGLDDLPTKGVPDPSSDEDLPAYADGETPGIRSDDAQTPSGSSSQARRYDERIILRARPLQVVYHVATVVRVTDALAPPRTLSLQQLQAAALNQLEVAKERSMTGLQAAVEGSKRRDISLSVMPSRLLLPEHGQITGSCCVLVMSLGALSVRSASPQVSPSGEGAGRVLPPGSYDHYRVRLTDVQVRQLVKLCISGASLGWINPWDRLEYIQWQFLRNNPCASSSPHLIFSPLRPLKSSSPHVFVPSRLRPLTSSSPHVFVP
ncbi:VPS13 repeated coiled region, partial [Trinorchestia longiramus]